jgi:hypothetical protein
MPNSSSWRHHHIETTTVTDRPHLAGADLDAGHRVLHRLEVAGRMRA